MADFMALGSGLHQAAHGALHGVDGGAEVPFAAVPVAAVGAVAVAAVPVGTVAVGTAAAGPLQEAVLGHGRDLVRVDGGGGGERVLAAGRLLRPLGSLRRAAGGTDGRRSGRRRRDGEPAAGTGNEGPPPLHQPVTELSHEREQNPKQIFSALKERCA